MPADVLSHLKSRSPGGMRGPMCSLPARYTRLLCCLRQRHRVGSAALQTPPLALQTLRSHPSPSGLLCHTISKKQPGAARNPSKRWQNYHPLNCGFDSTFSFPMSFKHTSQREVSKVTPLSPHKQSSKCQKAELCKQRQCSFGSTLKKSVLLKKKLSLLTNNNQQYSSLTPQQGLSLRQQFKQESRHFLHRTKNSGSIAFKTNAFRIQLHP